MALLAFCIVAEIARELCFKAGAERAQAAPVSYAIATLQQPLVWAGIAAWGIEMVGWVMVLQRAPLGIAFPIMTLTYAGVPLAGVLLLKEKTHASQIVGTALVTAGVVCVGLSGS
jgi:undecaprenyl phosphate-alpha-L-ara4N flippase subunit ArnE